jgi:hypothetical protein
MTENEIKREVLEAKDQRKQIQIVADQNDCEPEVIKEILKELGVDLRSLKGEKKHIDHGTKHKPHKKPVNAEKNPANAVKKSVNAEPDPTAQALAVLYARVAELLKQRDTINEELVALNVQVNRISDVIAGRVDDESAKA